MTKVEKLGLQDLWKRLVNWFLNKAPTKLETFEDERIEGTTITLIRYRRKTVRAFRTWRAVYKGLNYDLIFGWNTLQYLPDVPNIPKKNRLSTHTAHIYKQGLHARFNAYKGVHEPDIERLLEDEVCLETVYMHNILSAWRQKTQSWETPIYELEDLHSYIIDQVALYALRNPPPGTDPLLIDWREVIHQTASIVLGETDKHQVFLPPRNKTVN